MINLNSRLSSLIFAKVPSIGYVISNCSHFLEDYRLNKNMDDLKSLNY